jgi:hypothetical protein
MTIRVAPVGIGRRPWARRGSGRSVWLPIDPPRCRSARFLAHVYRLISSDDFHVFFVCHRSGAIASSEDDHSQDDAQRKFRASIFAGTRERQVKTFSCHAVISEDGVGEVAPFPKMRTSFVDLQSSVALPQSLPAGRRLAVQDEQVCSGGVNEDRQDSDLMRVAVVPGF